MKFFFRKKDLDSRKKTILFVHEAGGSHLSWDFQLPLEKDFNIITVDLPGHGQSKGEGMETLEEHSEAVHQLVHQEFSSLLPLILVGHSMGGGIVQHYALIYPQDVLAIILVGTGAKMRVTNQILDNILEDFEGVVNLISQYGFHQSADPRIIQKKIDQFLECLPEVMLRDFKACDAFNLFNEVKNISVPTLIICGTDDLLTPLKFSKYLHDQIPKSKLVEISEAGHMTMLEKPQVFNQALKNFVDSI
ncbi:MAG: alpha/beta fold hydrolase [Candidatus Hodarchaeota archaeon]